MLSPGVLTVDRTKTTILILLLAVQACSSLYVRNRMRDAADIVTLEAETGSYGASARVGPLKAGLSYKSPEGFAGGLRGGEFGAHESSEFTIAFFGADRFAVSEKDIPEKRGKEFHARSPFGTERSLRDHPALLKDDISFAPPHYFTQIELSFGLFLGLKVGLNLGELVDFLLGFLFVDILSDDEPFEAKERHEVEKHPLWDTLDEETQKRILEELEAQGL